MAVTLNSSQVQQNFGAALDRAARGEDVIVERYGTPRAVLIEYDRYRELAAAARVQAAGQACMKHAPVSDSAPGSGVRSQEAEIMEHAPASASAQSGAIKESAAAYVVTPERQARPAPLASAAVPAYRYVTQSPGVCGGRPIVRGTRVSVQAVVGYHKLGLSLDEILAALPHLAPAQVYEALSYYYDHLDEIEQEIRENQLERLIERYHLQVAADGRITAAG